MLDFFVRLVRRDLLLAWRRRADVLTTLAFYVVVVTLFPLGIGAEPQLLHAVAAGVLWVCALLASLLSLHRMFAADHADGTLEQLLLSPQPPTLLVLGKVAAHWLTTGAPLLPVAAVLGLQFDLEQSALGVLCLSLALGTPSLSLLGAVGAALTLGTRGGGLLLGLLVLPLCAPVLIFGAGAVSGWGNPGAEANLLLMGAYLLAAAAFCPWAAATGLRIAVE
ncbi:MAG: heme exporter protein CcmB [Betaproteobacteria bacterium]|nr:heme exporter protein CcmB [Betaproteobacteria bacterium]